MPMHDWTRVEAGIFHAFHHRWISAISDTLNSGLRPRDYYALPEQQAAGFGPDVLTLQDRPNQRNDESVETGSSPHIALTATNQVHGRVGCRVLPQKEEFRGCPAR